jgi:hypothetical protein
MNCNILLTMGSFIKMRIRSFGFIPALIFFALLAGCVKSADVKKPAAPINHVALVSVSVANWRGMVTGTAGSSGHAAELIENNLAHLTAETESQLSSIMRVTRVAGFIRNSGYRNLGVKNSLEILVPKMNGVPLEVFAKDNDDLIAANLPPEVAKKLCADLKVDAVVVVYSEWAWSQGHFVPTRRALTKDVVSVWDKHGNLVFHKRVDTDGQGVLGGPYGPIVVNAGTIQQWGGAYLKGFEAIVTEMANLRHS